MPEGSEFSSYPNTAPVANSTFQRLLVLAVTPVGDGRRTLRTLVWWRRTAKPGTGNKVDERAGKTASDRDVVFLIRPFLRRPKHPTTGIPFYERCRVAGETLGPRSARYSALQRPSASRPPDGTGCLHYRGLELTVLRGFSEGTRRDQVTWIWV